MRKGCPFLASTFWVWNGGLSWSIFTFSSILKNPFHIDNTKNIRYTKPQPYKNWNVFYKVYKRPVYYSPMAHLLWRIYYLTMTRLFLLLFQGPKTPLKLWWGHYKIGTKTSNTDKGRNNRPKRWKVIEWNVAL